MAKPLTNAWVSKMVREKGLKASQADLKQLARMLKDEVMREEHERRQAAEKVAVLDAQNDGLQRAEAHSQAPVKK